MTARADERRRRTLIGAVVAAVLIVSAAGLTAVGANAVLNSTEGEVAAVDSRPVLSLPATDNAALAVVDDDNRLTSLIVATLLPAGQGGTIVTIPVTADSTALFGEVRRPLNRELNSADPSSFFQQVEATVAVTLQFGEIVGANRLTELLEPTIPVTVDVGVDVIDSDDQGARVVVGAGEQRLDGPLLAAALTATEAGADERTQHAIDVALWTGVADSAPVNSSAPVTLDGDGRPTESATVDELFARLWSGPVQVRDLQIIPPAFVGSDSFVVLDRRDVVLVFAQISPARVSAPNPGPVFRLEIPITAAQLAASDSGLASRQEIALEAIATLLFLDGNVVSVDATPSPDGAPLVTRIEAASEEIFAAMEELGPPTFGEVEVVLAKELIDSIDVVVRLGTSYLDAQAAQAVAVEVVEPNASTPDDAATVDTDG
ncbi:MAG: hypothetical protein HOJ85_13430 [Ilumatobacter sp.]|uniref:hypothetical protein n=2 Tax=Ilumatobacter sp. TaxID=1967498 RepID=UPI001DB7E968|nr:hypothetical protein [Ilumatobacter sp.]MBT5554753.1 hypothetical protein [Ilumatobacter sp.]MBT5864189.1 hypothetical protein [Ilumatobacter sp.]